MSERTHSPGSDSNNKYRDTQDIKIQKYEKCERKAKAPHSPGCLESSIPSSADYTLEPTSSGVDDLQGGDGDSGDSHKTQVWREHITNTNGYVKHKKS